MVNENIHPDQTLLEVAATWWVARYDCLAHWAKADKNTLFGIRSDEPAASAAPGEPLDTFRQATEAFPFSPKTIMGARESLKIALELLEHRARDPEASLAHGPAFEIIRAVIAEMDCCPDELLRLPRPEGC